MSGGSRPRRRAGRPATVDRRPDSALNGVSAVDVVVIQVTGNNSWPVPVGSVHLLEVTPAAEDVVACSGKPLRQYIRDTSGVPLTPQSRYVRLGDAFISYQVWGDGPMDLIAFGSPATWPLDLLWDEPRVAEALERLGGFARQIWMEPRGVGASSRSIVEAAGGLEDWIESMAAVTAETESERAAVLGIGDGGPAAVLYAATFPERVSALVLVNTFARFTQAPDYPLGVPVEAIEGRPWPYWATTTQIGSWAPSMVDDAAWCRWWLRSQRLTFAPNDAAAAWRNVTATNVHHVLPSIQAPTLVLHRRGDRHAQVEHGRYLAEHIPHSTYRELDGDDHMIFAGDTNALLDEIEEFLTGVRPPIQSDRVLVTVLFTDVVGSSERAAALGDQRWRGLLDAHDTIVRGQLVRYRGREVKTTGDGFVATFDGPARAVRCATEIAEAVRALGIEIRAGVHTGEVELRGDDIGGVSVHTAARVQSLAQPGEVLVSRTVTDLVAGAGIEFEERGDHELKGIPGQWTLFAAVR